MDDDLEKKYRPLLEAVAFAARAHDGQLRKDDRTPYASHVFRVCLITAEVFGVSDPGVLMAAVLHDTVEDTTTDHDDLAGQFGRDIADWVATLSKDKRLTEDERENAYCDALARAPWQVQVCKLADVFDNLLDSVHLPESSRSRKFRNAHRYLDALNRNLKEPARRPWEVVSRLVRELESRDNAAAGGS